MNIQEKQNIVQFIKKIWLQLYDINLLNLAYAYILWEDSSLKCLPIERTWVTLLKVRSICVFGHLKYDHGCSFRIIDFGNKYGTFLSSNSRDYMNGNYSKKRYALVTIVKIISLVIGIRWAISAIINRFVDFDFQ